MVALKPEEYITRADLENFKVRLIWELVAVFACIAVINYFLL